MAGVGPGEGAAAPEHDGQGSWGGSSAVLRLDPDRVPRRGSPWTTVGSFVSLGMVRVFRRRRDRRSVPITMSLG